VIAPPDGLDPVLVNTTGTPWLATAGTGDVLAGLAGALLAQGLLPPQAAICAAYLHGLAARLAVAGGDRAADEDWVPRAAAPIGAADVAAALPLAFRALLVLQRHLRNVGAIASRRTTAWTTADKMKPKNQRPGDFSRHRPGVQQDTAEIIKQAHRWSPARLAMADNSAGGTSAAHRTAVTPPGVTEPGYGLPGGRLVPQMPAPQTPHGHGVNVPPVDHGWRTVSDARSAAVTCPG